MYIYIHKPSMKTYSCMIAYGYFNTYASWLYSGLLRWPFTGKCMYSGACREPWAEGQAPAPFLVGSAAVQCCRGVARGLPLR